MKIYTNKYQDFCGLRSSCFSAISDKKGISRIRQVENRTAQHVKGHLKFTIVTMQNE